MNTKRKIALLIHCLLAGAFALLARPALAADRIELNDGSLVLGKIVSADGGMFKVETSFAGTIVIAQDKIKSFSTDEVVNVGLAAGTAVLGKVESTDAGIKVVAADGQMTSTTAKVAAVWRAGADSPETRAAKELAKKMERKWAYEASVAIAGRTGVSEKFGAAFGFKATLASAQDKLIFALAAERAEDNGVKTADRQFGSVDYSSYFSADNGWYARTSLERDKIKLLDLRSSSAFGFSRRLIKNAKQDLEARIGFNYLYDSYSNNTTFSSPGLDLALLHSYLFGDSKLTNMVSYTPAFKEFTNYRMHHESAFEMPIAASQWKLKIGVANDYLSVPPAGTERLDTTYFTSLILNWH